MQPNVLSGRFHAGRNFRCGKNVTVNVAEECVLGDNCTLADDAHIEGRRVTFGDHLYVAHHFGRRLEVGLNRRSSEHAVLIVGSRCTLHDNRIDLTRRVTLGDDVGLSPEVCIYSHGYWQSVLDGFPRTFAPVAVGDGVIVGFRATLLPGAGVPDDCVIGAGAVVAGVLTHERAVYAGVPAKFVRPLRRETDTYKRAFVAALMDEYRQSLLYRNLGAGPLAVHYPRIDFRACCVDVEERAIEGTEDEYTDDLRWCLFTAGIRVFSDGRPFKQLEKR